VGRHDTALNCADSGRIAQAGLVHIHRVYSEVKAETRCQAQLGGDVQVVLRESGDRVVALIRMLTWLIASRSLFSEF